MKCKKLCWVFQLSLPIPLPMTMVTSCILQHSLGFMNTVKIGSVGFMVYQLLLGYLKPKSVLQVITGFEENIPI